MSHSSPPLVCDLSKLTVSERRQLEAVVAELFPSANEVRALPDGYALGYLDASAETISKMAEFITYDRLCCGFLTHALVSEPLEGITWLRMTGRDGAKEVLAADVKQLVSPNAVIVGDL